MNLLHALFAVNRPDLLKLSLDSVKSLWPHTIIIDNSPNGYIGREHNWPVEVVRSSVPLSCPQTMNFLTRLAEERNVGVFSWQHHDAEAHAGTAEAFLAAIEDAQSGSRNWAAIMTFYDLLSAYRMAAVRDIGEWDTEFPVASYSADSDWFHRCRAAGYEILETGLGVTHLRCGSQTIRTDAKFRRACDAKAGMNATYYEAKWGGQPNEERFSCAWNDSDLPDAAVIRSCEAPSKTGDIYDCFIFHDELDLLDIRLHELDGVVDKFVICESTRTHSNLPKPLYFAENRQRYQQFADKIVHLVFDCDIDHAQQNENSHRRHLATAFADMKAGDYVMISDLDEIPRASKIAENLGSGLRQFWQVMSYYHVNRRCGSWCGTRLLPVAELPRYGKDPMRIRFAQGIVIWDGGWHFSYLMDVARLKRKLDSFMHTNLNVPEFNSPDRLAHCLETGEDLFGRGMEWKLTDSLDDLPAYLLANKTRYSHLFYEPATA